MTNSWKHNEQLKILHIHPSLKPLFSFTKKINKKNTYILNKKKMSTHKARPMTAIAQD